MTKLRLQRVGDRLRSARRGPVFCRMCGATLGEARAVLENGRVRLDGFEGTVVRVRWTAEDELAFEHVRPGDCDRA